MAPRLDSSELTDEAETAWGPQVGGPERAGRRATYTASPGTRWPRALTCSGTRRVLVHAGLGCKTGRLSRRPAALLRGRFDRPARDVLLALQRTQEVEKVLLRRVPEIVESVDDPVRFRAIALVFPDRLHQVLGPTVMQEEDPLTESPERRGPEIAAAPPVPATRHRPVRRPCRGSTGRKRGSRSDFSVR